MKKLKRIKKIDGSCAPLALKYLCGYADTTVYDACTINWFQQQNGMEEHEFLKAAKHLKIRGRRMNLKKKEIYRIKLRNFILEYPTGKFLIYTDAHLFVLHNGEVIDPLNEYAPGLDRLVTGAWHVFN